MCLRIRPINAFEQTNGESVIMSSVDNSLVVEGRNQIRQFFFDYIFDAHSSQEEVFNECGIKRLIQLTIEGFEIFISKFKYLEKISQSV